jgi:hypothetical protein
MIVLATTTIDVLSPGASDTEAEDWGGAPDSDTGYAPVRTGVRAHLSSPTGAQSASVEGNMVINFFRLVADPCGLQPNNRVKDNSTGVVYDVQWCQERGAPIPHTVAGLTYAKGSA